MSGRMYLKGALLALLMAAGIVCATVPAEREETARMIEEYLAVPAEDREVFRVLMLSDSYTVRQLKHTGRIKRSEDPGGDKYICDEIKRFDKIDEVREGILSVWLFPDTGRLMKVRPKKLTYLMEVDKLIVEDIQRWNFQFDGRVVEPTQFDVRYRVALRKRQSDEEIMREVRERIKEKESSH